MILFLFSGSFSALFAVIAELVFFAILSPSGMGTDPWRLDAAGAPPIPILGTFFFVAVIEESMKLLVLARQTERTGSKNLPVPAVLFGLGFAMTEITLASISGIGSAIPVTAAGGMLVLHILTTFLYGTALPFGKNRMKLALAIGISIHLIYDILLALL